MASQKFLIWGYTGWIGSQIYHLLESQGISVVAAQSRLENFFDIVDELENVHPSHVINASGITGRPNVDWCEDHPGTTYKVNVYGFVNLARACHDYGVHLTVFNSGCIYDYPRKSMVKPLIIEGSGVADDALRLITRSVIGGDEGIEGDDPRKSSKGEFDGEKMDTSVIYSEDDKPNFLGSTYAISKMVAENIMKEFDNVLILRLRMPVSSDPRLNPRCFVSKILRYSHILDVPNSMSVLEELLPVAVDMAKKRVKGVFNFTNPGTISHVEILTLYRDLVDSKIEWQRFTPEEDRKLNLRRSNCHLDTSKLTALYPDIRPIKTAFFEIFNKLKNGDTVVG